METVTYELQVQAAIDTLPEINAFVEEHLSMNDCPLKTVNQILLSVEEAYVNVANYAYGDGQGMCRVIVQVGDPSRGIMQTDMPCEAGQTDSVREVTIRLIDSGQPFDPLAKEDPDTTLGADERQIGGLGIFMIKKLMDAVDYERIESENILTMKKQYFIRRA